MLPRGIICLKQISSSWVGDLIRRLICLYFCLYLFIWKSWKIMKDVKSSRLSSEDKPLKIRSAARMFLFPCCRWPSFRSEPAPCPLLHWGRFKFKVRQLETAMSVPTSWRWILPVAQEYQIHHTLRAEKQRFSLPHVETTRALVLYRSWNHSLSQDLPKKWAELLGTRRSPSYVWMTPMEHVCSQVRHCLMWLFKPCIQRRASEKSWEVSLLECFLLLEDVSVV